MNLHDLQGIEIKAPLDKCFAYLADANKLPEWTNAFASVSPGKAKMRTPQGESKVELELIVAEQQGTVDYKIVFPDGGIGMAYTRLVEIKHGVCAYSFVLPAPPVALEQLEGALQEQSKTLREELQTLKRVLEQ